MPLIQFVQAPPGGTPLWLQFLTACVPAGLALGGVLWSLRNARVLADRQRVLSMKREVYMAAAEALSTGSLALVSFVNVDIPTKEVMAGYLTRAPAIAKVHVIANPKLGVAISAAVTHLGSATMRLHHSRISVDELIRAAAGLEKLADSAQSSVDAAVAGMQSHNLEGIANPRRFEVLQQNFKFSSEQKASLLSRASDMRSQCTPLLVKMVSVWEDEATALGLKMIPVLAAARKELELPFDREAYMKMYEAQTKAAKVELRKYINGLPPIEDGDVAPISTVGGDDTPKVDSELRRTV